MVYSTCSLARSQNEGIVEWFLENNRNATLLPLDDVTKGNYSNATLSLSVE
jgi:16S rRNA C967 or C1407 C5-methylase (RsmB/RsmF family)